MGVAYCKVPVRARWERMLRKKTVPSVKGLLALVSLARQVCVSATARATYVRQKGARKRGESSRPDFTHHGGPVFGCVLASFWWAESLVKSRGQISPSTVASCSLLFCLRFGGRVFWYRLRATDVQRNGTRKGGKTRQKGDKRKPKGIKIEPNGSQRLPKWGRKRAKGSQRVSRGGKGAKIEPKGSRDGAQRDTDGAERGPKLRYFA